MDSFRSGLQSDNGNWIYSLQSTFEQFVAMYPEDQVDYRSFTIHTTRIVETFLNTGNVAKAKSTVLNNVNERVAENPHISMSDHFSSSDEDLEEIVAVLNVPKAEHYFEEIVPQFNDQQHIEHLCISRNVTQELANQFETSEYYHHQEGDSEKISPLKAITVFLWFAANEAASFRDVADRFDIAKRSLHKIPRYHEHVIMTYNFGHILRHNDLLFYVKIMF
ncbi:hypothetical protein MML48_9g00000302 [Holotrichia oblita]|uniref:Uncharacterized protein n=1 Tax=Holotrichia oblita TaxID=644536 RepID=A0ACB9SU26_HOLOL|nr:hypothetical protein MML48_9g00000302 [Holotrichia oblita]